MRPEIEGENENLSNSSIKMTKVRMAMQKLPGVGSGESPDSLNSKVDVAQLLWSRLREDLLESILWFREGERDLISLSFSLSGVLHLQ